jgi:sugar transferase (PEP-CTERM system associated)
MLLRLFGHYISGMLVATLAIDVAIIVGAVALENRLAGWMGEGTLLPKTIALSAIIVLSLYLADLYRVRPPAARRDLVLRLLLGLGCSAILAAAAGFAVPALRLGRLAFLEIFGLVALGLLTWRSAWLRLHPDERLRKRVLVLGVSGAADAIVKLQDAGPRPFTLLGFLDDDPGVHDRLPAGAELMGKARDLLNLVDELRPDLVLVALHDMRGAFPAHDLLECRLRGIRVEDWPTFYEKQTGKILVTDLRPSWLIFSDGFANTHVTQALKRGADIGLALVGLVLALPLMALAALAITLDSRGPVLFRQERVGRNGRIFVINKFRSMRVDAERGGPVWASPNDPRITRIGRFLRRTRIDELPQLLNVLVGDMSFIGPRPERPEFVQVLRRRIPFYTERLAVKPGITGWAQVRHEYGASVEDALEKLQYDLYYIKHLSPFLDLLILLSTVQVVLLARGSR